MQININYIFFGKVNFEFSVLEFSFRSITTAWEENIIKLVSNNVTCKYLEPALPLYQGR